MTLAKLRDKADPILTTFWLTLKVRQEAYFIKHGRYFYLFISPTQAVIDGVETPYILRQTPDQEAIDDVPLIGDVPFQLRIDEFRSPTATWFEGTVLVTLPNGDTYKRSRTNTGIDSGWGKVIKTI